MDSVEFGGTSALPGGGNPEPSFFLTAKLSNVRPTGLSGGQRGKKEEGVETLRLRPKADIHGQEKVQATNRKGGESHRSKKIRWGESPVRVRVPPPAVSYFFALLPVAAGFNVCR